MKSLQRTALVLFSIFAFLTVTQAQEKEPFKLTVELREPSSATSWFTLKPSRPYQNQTSTDPYVFPDSDKRFRRYVINMVGPFALLKTAASAAINQWNDNPEEWGQGAQGYGKRFASNLGGNAIRQTVTYGLSEALHLDTGFERSKRKGFWPRLSDALVQNVTSRTRSGKRVISAPIFAGAYAGAIIPTVTWYPERYGYKDGLREGTYALASGLAINVLREFVFNW
ncbi:MAG TPA: hypothetical protein VI306_19130 [Pyrinomonadaceae bacterium]